MSSRKDIHACITAFERIFETSVAMIRYLNGVCDEMDEDDRKRIESFKVIEFPVHGKDIAVKKPKI